MNELRQKLETSVLIVEGDLASALSTLGDEGWTIVQVLPQPDGKVGVIVQRPRLAVITDLSHVPPNLKLSS